MNSPRMWSRIEVLFCYYFGDPLRRFDQYILACMTRSQDMPINVVLDLKMLLSPEEFIESVMSSIPYFEVYDGSELLSKHWEGMDWEDFSKTGYYDYIQEAIDALIGPQGTYISRWKSLRISLPAIPHVCRTILESFAGYPLKPTTLELNEYDIDEWMEIQPYISALGDLSDVESLEAGCPPVLSTLAIRLSNLRYLKLRFRGMESALMALTDFTSLLSLELFSETAIDGGIPAFSIRLPTL